MKNSNHIAISIVHKPKRKVICKRGIKAKEYVSYCEEVGCNIWTILSSMESLCGEPVCLWLPEQYKTPNTSTYVQGIEVAFDDQRSVPEGFDTICLPACDYLMFQGLPFEEKDYGEAICLVQQAIDQYHPNLIGYEWDDEHPRIQLEPRSTRGYIELRAVKSK